MLIKYKVLAHFANPDNHDWTKITEIIQDEFDKEDDNLAFLGIEDDKLVYEVHFYEDDLIIKEILKVKFDPDTFEIL